MSADPVAPVPTIDAATGEILVFTGPTVPRTQYAELERELAAARHEAAELQDQVDALNKSLARDGRAIRALQKEIDDLMDQSADRETVRTCLVFWRDWTDRKANTRIDLSTGRARHVRWILRHWTPREFCVAVVGMMNYGWPVERGKTDVLHMCTQKGAYCEGRFEEFLALGRTLVPDKPVLEEPRLRPSKPPANIVRSDAPDDDYVPE